MIHFGYRDNLSAIGIEGWAREHELEQLNPVSRHAAGEFVLGHPQNSGANPWLGSGTQVWPEGLRAFFHNASFGVLHQVQQGIVAFDAFVAKAAKANDIDADIVLRDLPAFTRTRGTAYLFFPSLTALEQIADGLVFPFGKKDDER